MNDQIKPFSLTGTKSWHKALIWYLLMALAIVQFSGQVHRVKHADISQPNHSWVSDSTVAKDDAKATSHFHSCALSDAASLGFGPLGHDVVTPPYHPLIASASTPEAPAVLTTFVTSPPPARAPPMTA